jgi:hypothetical protein
MESIASKENEQVTSSSVGSGCNKHLAKGGANG